MGVEGKEDGVEIGGVGRSRSVVVLLDCSMAVRETVAVPEWVAVLCCHLMT